jgi:hypothetical protein
MIGSARDGGCACPVFSLALQTLTRFAPYPRRNASRKIAWLGTKGMRTKAMTIYGMSQSTGVERRLMIEQGGEGLVLTITDHATSKEQQRILVQPDDLIAAVTDPPAGGTSIDGVAPPHGAKMGLHIDVHRNEIQLKVNGGLDAGAGADIAVGLDDFQDALEQVMKRS